jgi:hypothetical protein
MAGGRRRHPRRAAQCAGLRVALSCRRSSGPLATDKERHVQPLPDRTDVMPLADLLACARPAEGGWPLAEPLSVRLTRMTSTPQESRRSRPRARSLQWTGAVATCAANARSAIAAH